MRGSWSMVALPCLLLGCRASGPVVRSAVEIGVLPQSTTIVGRDGGGSGWVWERSVWAFGDTVLSLPDEFDRSWHHNSVSITTDRDASDGIEGFVEPLDGVGAPLHFIAPTVDEYAFNEAHAGDPCPEQPCGARWAVWPGPPIWDADNARALVFYSLIYAEPGEFNFGAVGYSIATWSDPEGLPQRPIIDASAEHPDLLWVGEQPGWGITGNIVDGWLYTFACDNAGGFGHDCKLARAELADIHELAAWRYWTGEDWSSDDSQATVLFEGAPSMSIDFNEFLGEWLAIYSPPFDSRVLARTAPELSGPWSHASLIYDAGDDEPYDAVAHREYEQDGGRILYVTYSRPTGGWFGAEFPLVRVELDG